MSFELAEKLKQKFTDKWVVVDASVPELKRFAQWTGKVKTVNMNGRALVEFDGPVDIGWYDIDPAYLTVVDGPKPKAAKAEKPAAKPAAAPAAAAPAAGGKSPLDQIRAQQAAKSAGGAPAAAPAGEAKKMSPLDLVRAQQAAKAGGAAPAAPPAPAAAPAPAAGGAKLSPIEMIRQQQAAKKAAEGGTVPAPAAAEVEPAPAPAPAAPAAKAPVPTTSPDGKPLSKIDLIRMQGAAKR